MTYVHFIASRTAHTTKYATHNLSSAFALFMRDTLPELVRA